MNSDNKRDRRISTDSGYNVNLAKRSKPTSDVASDCPPLLDTRQLEIFTVAWICALPVEAAAAIGMLDTIYEDHRRGPDGDPNIYTLGCLGPHRIVIVTLIGFYGPVKASRAATHMERTFKSIKYCLLVGIGGGVPGSGGAIRLGDVVVGTEIVPSDSGKIVGDGSFEPSGLRSQPPEAFHAAVTRLRTIHKARSNKIAQYVADMVKEHPFMAEYSCNSDLQDHLINNSTGQPIPRVRATSQVKIHYGIIASGNQVIKHGDTRDNLAQKLNNICFEMEAAGLHYDIPCLVIRGICDYADANKSKEWQPYAAATASAYAKELLMVLGESDTTLMNTNTEPILSTISSTEHRNLLFESLKFIELEHRYNSVSAALKSTCKWFLQNPSYLAWKNPSQFDQHNGLLWIKGKPGAGKSTLMKFIHDDTLKLKQPNEAVLSFFFNARGGSLEKSVLGMYRSLLYQLLEKLPHLKNVLDTASKLWDGSGEPPEWKLADLQHLFAQAVSNLGEYYITCFIDALDECPEDEIRDELLEKFQMFSDAAIQANTKIYICLSSRYYPNIDIPIGLRVELDNQTGHSEDIQKYVRAKLYSAKGKTGEKICNEIFRKADGVFIWVVLVVSILQRDLGRGNVHHIEKRLNEIPAKLSELFKDILQRDTEDIEDTLLCLQWVLFSNRPMRLEEFYFAMMAGINMNDEENPEPWDSEEITVETMRLFILSSSKGLVEVTRTKSKTVQVIHESVRDFLIKENGLGQLGAGYGGEMIATSHDRLKKCCWKYCIANYDCHINTESSTRPKADEAKEERLRLTETFPFLQYSVDNVLYHADAANYHISQKTFLVDFPLQQWAKIHAKFQIHRTRQLPEDITMIYVLASYGLSDLIQLQLDSGCDAWIKGRGKYIFPVCVAIANKHLNAVKSLLQLDGSEYEREILAELQSGIDSGARFTDIPLSWACRAGFNSLVRYLIAEGFSMQSDDGRCQFPLYAAIERGQESTVKLLLEQNPDIPFRYETHRKPDPGGALRPAVEKNFLPITRMLLEYGLRGAEAFLGALTENNTSSLSLLMQYDYRQDVIDTLLFYEITRERYSAIKLLLSFGAEINQTVLPTYWGSRSSTLPLDRANLSSSDSQRIAVHRIYNRAEVHYTDCTVLECAIIMGNIEIIRLLLDSGVELSLTKSSAIASAVILAIKDNALPMLQLLLERCTYLLDQEEKQGAWALALNMKNNDIILALSPQFKPLNEV